MGKSDRKHADTGILSGSTGNAARDPAQRVGSGFAPAGVTIASSIEFDRINHSFGQRQTLQDVSFIAAPGQVVCLLGPSGSGKTTLLRLAAGLAAPTAGRVLIDGREVSAPGRIIPPEKRGVGLVFQDFALFPHLTVIQNVEFGLVQLGKSQRRAHAMRMLETVGMDHEAEKYPHALSGGEQQRVALARALAPKPGILLMDEPFSGLDARLRDSIREETLNLLQATRSTVLLVTHDPEEALSIADRIVLMRGGKVIQTGTCDDLYSRPNSLFAARFFTPLNVLPGIMKEAVIETPLGDLAAGDVVTKPGANSGTGNLNVCVRPGDFTLGVARGNDPKAVEVYIRKRRFLGEWEHLEVVHQATEIHVDLRCSPGEIPADATQLSLSINPQKAMVFAEE